MSISISNILDVPNLQIFDNAAFVPFQPLNPNTCRNPSKENITPSPIKKQKQQQPKPTDIDAEISEIEAQINLLARKLQSLKTKKAQLALLTSKTPNPSKRSSIGRVVPAKFLNKIETTTPTPSKKQPEEARRRRGLSLGPAEIYDHKASTPFTTRKPTGFLKLEGIKEEKQGTTSTISARRRGMSLGPSEISKSVKAAELRKGVATVGPKQTAAKRDIQESMSGVLRPKALFEDKKRPNASAKVRVVASRYNSSGNVGDGNKRRKWSLPEEKEEKDEKRRMRMRTLSLGGGNLGPSTSSIMKIAEGLPRIRTERRMVESPRDSGCAKRVAELAGRRSCFAQDDDGPCRSLEFEDGDPDQCVYES